MVNSRASRRNSLHLIIEELRPSYLLGGFFPFIRNPHPLLNWNLPHPAHAFSKSCTFNRCSCSIR
jgi:hypothetical protein